MRNLEQLQINWHSNAEQPSENDHIVLVYSKKNRFISELCFWPEEFDENGEEVFNIDGSKKNPAKVTNDEGYFSMPWEEVDGWISINEIRTSMFGEKPEVDESQSPVEDFIESEQQIDLLVQPHMDAEYNVVLIQLKDTSRFDDDEYFKPILKKFEGLTPSNYHLSFGGDSYTLCFSVDGDYIDIDINNIGKPTGAFDRAYVVCSSDTDLDDAAQIVIEYAINSYNDSRDWHEKELSGIKRRTADFHKMYPKIEINGSVNHGDKSYHYRKAFERQLVQAGYAEASFPAGTDIAEFAEIFMSDYVKKFSEGKQFAPAYTNFNDAYLLSSDKDITVDKIYQLILGKSKAEHEAYMKDYIESINKNRSVYEKKVPQLTEKYIKAGKEIVDEKYWDKWASLVKWSLEDIYQDSVIISVLELIKEIKAGKTPKECKELSFTQGHSAMSMSIVCMILRGIGHETIANFIMAN